MYQVIIKNGTIIDGTGAAMFSGDIGIKEGKICEIGNLQNENAEEVIDARGKFVCPGFIDVDNHSDTFWRVFQNPELESLVYQGITTIIGGNCGSSLAPLANPGAILSIQKWSDVGKVNLDWMGMDEFLDTIQKLKLSVNFGTLAGHGTLRRGILAEERREISTEELGAVRKMLEKAMKNGALGLSTGLVFAHAKKAKRNEITELAKVSARFRGVYATHLRDEQAGLLGAVEEAIDICRTAGCKLHISHFKAAGEKNWDFQEEALFLLEQAKENGLAISFDVYPYTSTASVLYTLLPDWVGEGGRAVMLGRLKDPNLRQRIISEMKNNDLDYSKLIVSISTVSKELKRKKISEMARFQGKTAEECVLDILVSSGGRVIVMADLLSEENLKKALSHELAVISSNGAGYNLEYKKHGDLIHPRSFGAFPRVLGKYVREEKIITWENAIFKMTGKPAEIFGLQERGTLKKRNHADIVVFNPEIINDKSTMDDPFRYSQGVEWVMVNGEIVLRNGEYNGKREGKVIRHSL